MSLHKLIAAALSSLASGVALPISERNTVDAAVRALDAQAEKDAKAAARAPAVKAAGASIPREAKPKVVPAAVSEPKAPANKTE